MFTSKKDKLFKAAKKGDVAGIDNAIQAGADVHAKNSDGDTALHKAAQNGHVTAIDHLVNHYGADVHAKNNKGSTALLWAAWQGQSATIDHLVNRYGLDVHAKNNYSHTALHFAACNGHIDTIDHLVSRYGLDAHAKDNQGKTPAMLARERGKTVAAAKLEAYEKQYPAGPRASVIAGSSGSAASSSALPTPAFKNKEEAQAALFEAVEKGDIARIDEFVRHGADVRAKSSGGWTALHGAANNGDTAAIDALVRYGADVQARSNDGSSPLDLAAVKGHAGAIDALVRHGADVQAKSNYGWSALHWAAYNDQIAAIDALVRHGADVHDKDNDGKTPAMQAREQGKIEAAAKLEAFEKRYPLGPRPSQAATLSSSAAKSAAVSIAPVVAKPASSYRPASGVRVTTAAPTAMPAPRPLPTAPKVLPKAPIGKVIGLYPYQASDDNELSVMEGQRLLLIEKQASGWWLCELNGKRGLVPGTYLQEDVTSSASLASSSAQVSAMPSAGVVPVVITPSATPPHVISTPSHPSAPASSSSVTHSSVESEALSLADTKDFEQWVIPYDDLIQGKCLGRGSFGEVHLATYVHEPVAVKTLFVGETAKALEDFKREITVMMRLKSMYIVQLRAVTIKPYSMVMEYLPKGSLTQLLRNPSEPMPWSQRHQLASDIAKGLAFLHHHHVFHRDLKSDNVLLTDTYQAKLSDFGLSKIKAAGSKQSSVTGGSVGTPCWMAPEVLDDENKSPYRAASDVYSYAMIVWELMTRREPYEGLRFEQLFAKVVIKAQRELIPEDAPPILQAITAQGWAQSPEARPTADDIVKQLAANPIEPSSEPQVPMGLASNTSSVYGQRLGSALGVSGVGLAPNTASIAPSGRPSVLSRAGFWNNLASLPSASRASVPPTVIRR